MNNNTITIEKCKYRALLERVFQLELSENGQPLPNVIGQKIENLGYQMKRGEYTLAQIRSTFTDISLLADYVELVAGDELEMQEEIMEEIAESKSHSENDLEFRSIN